ncbi:type 1 fimbria pilin [Acinetobacter calcoaceticus]|uniref:Type 1 fimbria pilin n=1 Tax=Acinetobacter calcoaceticus TaxID=471 RepID=A0A4R1XXG1_ACICA|nr:type 1 fimbria pilin [Acinetobacter calcoaceticus]
MPDFKIILAVGLLLSCTPLFATCNIFQNPVSFSLGGNFLTMNKMTDHSHERTIFMDAQPNPDRSGAIFIGCLGAIERSNSYFSLTADSSLNPNDSRVFPTPQGDRKFLAITAPYINKPAGASSPKIYMSFSIYDPIRPENKLIISEPNVEYRMLEENTFVFSLGMAIDKIYVYIIIDQNSVPGLYSTGALKIGELVARSFRFTGSQSGPTIGPVNVLLSPSFSFQIKQSTCVLDQKNYMVKLDNVLSREFTAANQTLKIQNLNMTMRCADDLSGTRFNATLTDTSPQAQQNRMGLLSNQIPQAQGGSNVQVIILDRNNQPLPISSINAEYSFEFGSLDNNRQVSYPLKIAYHSTQMPVRPGNVKAIANINVDYQ